MAVPEELLALIRGNATLLFWDIPDSKPVGLSGAFLQLKMTANSTNWEAKRGVHGGVARSWGKEGHVPWRDTDGSWCSLFSSVHHGGHCRSCPDHSPDGTDTWGRKDARPGTGRVPGLYAEGPLPPFFFSLAGAILFNTTLLTVKNVKK
jgi:hypothetical protein